ncbi:MAG TPA: hypothetical protein VLX44_07040 [Xanthobacteraceae bacterium]|nr:hypothetical protein [Xanthobacteraceae bacterium]
MHGAMRELGQRMLKRPEPGAAIAVLGQAGDEQASKIIDPPFILARQRAQAQRLLGGKCKPVPRRAGADPQSPMPHVAIGASELSLRCGRPHPGSR